MQCSKKQNIFEDFNGTIKENSDSQEYNRKDDLLEKPCAVIN